MTEMEILHSEISNLQQKIWVDKVVRGEKCEDGFECNDKIKRIKQLEYELTLKEKQLKQIIIVEEHEARCAQYYLTNTHS